MIVRSIHTFIGAILLGFTCIGQNEFVQKIYEQDSSYLRNFKSSVTEWEDKWQFASSGTLNEEGWEDGDSLYFITWLSQMDSLMVVHVDTYTTRQIPDEVFQYMFIDEYYTGNSEMYVTVNHRTTFRFDLHLIENKRYKNADNFNLSDFNEWISRTRPYDNNEDYFIAEVSNETDNEYCSYRFSKRPGTFLFEEVGGWVDILNPDNSVEIKLLKGENCLDLNID